jgi:hypothetical protein
VPFAVAESHGISDRSEAAEKRGAGAEDRRIFDLLRLACVLAQDDVMRMEAPHVIWSRELLPFATSGGAVHVGHVEPHFFDTVIEPTPIAEWAELIGEGGASAVRIAARRLPLAVVREAEEALIDAVVVWESLFGGRADSTFRVTSSLARLLEADPGSRHELVARLKKTYGVRSDLVHGRHTSSDFNEHRMFALGTAMSAARASLRRGTEWLALGSERRSQVIVLE